jgi:hypothetical protein
LQQLVQDILVRNKDNDQWHYIWDSHKYTSKSFYNHLYRNINLHNPFYGSGIQDVPIN